MEGGVRPGCMGGGGGGGGASRLCAWDGDG